MNLLSWNCKGLGNLKIVYELKDPVSSNEPNCVFLLEDKIPQIKVECIKSLLGFHSLFYVDNLNNGGGLALMRGESLDM